MGRHRAAFYDPQGARYGLPTWPWQLAPKHLLTTRQLRARGLRPGGQAIAGQILWRGIGGVRAAYLYDVAHAAAKRVATPAQRRAIAKALTARRTCRSCGLEQDYYIPRSLGECLTCHDTATARWGSEDAA